MLTVLTAVCSDHDKCETQVGAVMALLVANLVRFQP